MTRASGLLVLYMVAGTQAAASWATEIPRCSTECSVTGSSKLTYVSGRTYSYSYSGTTRVRVRGVEGGASVTGWSSRVELTWASPCDVAISMREPEVDGVTGDVADRFLERYPLVVALTDGRVHHVCSHPDDDVWSVNLKKGVASAFQNSLPSLPPTIFIQNITETDVVGRCSTHYKAETKRDKVVVRKTKDHRMCQERYPTPAETHVPWLKGPLPVEESGSVCEQEIKNGIYWSIKCEDRNVIRPSYGAYKYVVATQESSLQYLSNSTQQPPSISNISRVDFVHKTLRYGYDSLNKDPSLVAELDHVVSQICDKTKEAIGRDAAALVVKALRLLRRVPEEAVENILTKIRSGFFTSCENQRRLESLFLDAVAFVHESGAVRVMVKELMEGRVTGGRTALYTAALFLQPRPDTRALEALKPIFESSQPFPYVTLAAASMVSTYCRHNPHCLNEPSVRSSAEALGNKLRRQCSSDSDSESQQGALATLKALGNMGVMTPNVVKSTLECLRTRDLETSVRVAATQAFRKAKCYRHAVTQLMDIALDPTEDTEVRIASYLAGIPCAQEDIQDIVTKIAGESNTQVRGFVLSHLHNVQRSSASDKEDLRYLLQNIDLPRDYDADLRKYSRNVDLTYVAPSLGVGATVESDIIYVPGSYVPRSVNLNITAALGDTLVNMGEVGARLEGLEPTIEDIFGPGGYLHQGSLDEVFRSLAGRKESEIMDSSSHPDTGKNYFDFSAISRFLSKIYGSGGRAKVPRAEVFARLMGQEMAFASLSKDLRNISVTDVLDSFPSYFKEMFGQMLHLQSDSARTAQLSVDYTLPTIQGTPVKLKLEGTGVLGMHSDSLLKFLDALNAKDSTETFRITPSFSLQVTGFIGYDCYLGRLGLEMNSTISLSNGASLSIVRNKSEQTELRLDLPHKMELFNMTSETYLMTGIRGRPDTRITPASLEDVRVVHQSCVAGSVLGLRFCYDVNVPDLLRSPAFPLGAPSTVRLDIEKMEPTMRGYLITVATQDKSGDENISLKVETPGSSTHREAEATWSYSKQNESYIISASVESTNITSRVWSTIVASEDHKGLEAYAQYKSNDVDVSRGVKVDLKSKSPAGGKQYEVAVYVSGEGRLRPESKIIEGNFMTLGSGPEVSVDAVFRTRNLLRNYIDFSFKAGSEVRYPPYSIVPLPTKLRQLEFHSGLGGWNMSSSVYRTKESNETVEFISVFKVVRRGDDLVSVKASYTMRGDQSASIAAVSTIVTAKIGDEEYKASYDVFCEPTKVGALAQLVRPRENTKILDLDVFAGRARRGYKAKFQLDVPEYMRAIKFESKITLQEQYRYLVEAALRHGEHAVLQVDGPLLAKLTRPVIQVQADLKIGAMPSGPHRISTTVILAGNKRVLSFELNNQRGPVFGTEVNLSLESLQRTKIITTLFIPSVVNHRLEVVMRSVVIHLNLNTTVLPSTSLARRLKSFVDVDLQRKNFKGELSWDADSDPGCKLSGEVTLATSSSAPRQATLVGNVIYKGDPYSYQSEVRLADPRATFHGRSSFTTRLTTPSHDTVILDASCDVRQQDHVTTADTRLAYSGLGNVEYRLTSSVDLEKLDGSHDYNLDSRFSFRSSEDQIRSTEDTLAMSLEAEFTLSSRENSSSGTCKAGKDTPLTLFSWDLLWHPEGRVTSIDIDVDMAAIKDNVRMIHQVMASEGYHDSGNSSGRASYHLLYHNPTPYTSSLVLQSPSRTMEGEAKSDPSEFRLRFYPNRNESEAKYELTVKRSATINGTQRKIRFEGHLHHPRLGKELLLGIQATTEGKTLQGKAELDIFPSTADKIVVTFNSTGISQNSLRTVAHLTSRALRVKPVFTVVTSHAPHMIALDVKIQKTPASRVSFKTSANYGRDSSRSAAFALLMATDDEGPLVDISGVVEPEEAAMCHGLMLKAVAHTSLLGTYDVHSKVCQPAFVELTSHKRASERVYTAKLGNQDFKTVEASLSLDDLRRQEEEEETGIVVARVMRTTPTLVTSGFGLNYDALREVQSAVREKVLKVSRRCASWAGQLYRDTVAEDLRNGSSSLTSQLNTLYEGTVEDMVHIYQDMAHDGLIPLYEDLQKLLLVDSRVLQVLVRSYRTAWEQLADLQNHYAHVISRLVLAAYQEFSDPAQLVAQVLTSTAQWVETGEPSALAHRLQQHLEQTRIFRLMSIDVDTLREQYPEENEIVKLVVSQVKQTVEQNLEKFREKILAHPSAQRVIQWIRKHLDFRRMGITNLKNEVVRILMEPLLIKVDTDKNYLEVRVPLPHPVYSLGQAVKTFPSQPLSSLATIMRSQFSFLPISVNDMIWAYHTLLPRRVIDQLPPFNGTAMVVGDTEILTFDGALLRVPRSPCEVLLSALSTSRLTMSHPQPSAPPRVTLITGRTNVTVEPDFTVMINGRPMTGTHKTVGNVAVNITPQEITIMSPYVTVRVMRRLHVISVKVSGWTFGRLAGLLGTYDGEVGNDWLMPSGRKASSLRELVKSWQEDSHCHTPAISPVSATVPPVQRVVQCLTLLEVPSRCYPIVHPEPFIKMCYGARNACDAAHAYWAICSAEGLHEIFSLSC